MPPPKPKPQRVMWLDRMSWLGGVFDTAVEFNVIERRKLPIGSAITGTFESKTVRAKVVEIIGGKTRGARHWWAPPELHLEITRRLIPYMQDPVKIHHANRILVYRMVMGSAGKKGTNELRKQLVGDAMRAFQERILQLPLDKVGRKR
jgi:hypothetical protein